MTATTSVPQSGPMKPPLLAVGPVAWLRDNLFSSVSNSLLTVFALYITWRILSGAVDWTILSAVWYGEDGSACRGDGVGACWPFIWAKLGQFMYGRFPDAERWRANLTLVMAIAGLAALMIPAIPGKKWSAIFMLLVFPCVAFWLLTGSSPPGIGWLDYVGFALAVLAVPLLVLGRDAVSKGLPPWTGLAGALTAAIAVPLLIRFVFSSSGMIQLAHVPTQLWGGMLVSLVVASVGVAGAFPVGIVLALGRRSRMPVARWVSVGFIEFVRGVPLITILFMASVMLPLFLPAGVTFDKLLRALIGVMLFQGAYMAETIRGGLQAIPRGQFEAADALGLSYAQKMGLIVLPQALKLVIPGIVNSVVGLTKDTSLVLIIGIFDLLGVVNFNLTDPKWFAPTAAMTGYVFCAMVFWIICFGISRYSTWLEKWLSAGERR